MVPVLDIVTAYLYSQGNVTCFSNVAGMGLQFLAQSNRGTNFTIAKQYVNNNACTYNGIVGTRNFTTRYCVTRLLFG